MLVLLGLPVDYPEGLVDELIKVHPTHLQVRLSLVDDVERVARSVDPQSFVGLEDSLDKLERNSILEIAAEVGEEEQALLDDPNVGLLEDA